MIREPQSEGQARAQCLHLLTQLGYEAVAEPLGPELCDFKRLDRALRRLNPGVPEKELRRAQRHLVDLLHGGGMPWGVACTRGHSALHQGLVVPFLRQPLRILDTDRRDGNELTAHGPDADGRLWVAHNGVPLALLLCTEPERTGELAGDRLYQAAQEALDADRMPTTVTLMGIAAQAHAVAGMPLSLPSEMLPWAESYPLPERQLARLLKRPLTPQDTLLTSALSPSCLQELARFFLHGEEHEGQWGLRFARQHQFIAVQRALARLRSRRGGRGGLIRHASGSGRTQTLLWLALRILRAARQDRASLRLVVLSDRPQVSERLALACDGLQLPPPILLGEIGLRALLRTAGAGPRDAALLASPDALREALPIGEERAGEGLVLLLDEPTFSLGLLLRRRLPGAAFLTVTAAAAPTDAEEVQTQWRSLGPELHRFPPPATSPQVGDGLLPYRPRAGRRPARAASSAPAEALRPAPPPRRPPEEPTESRLAHELARLLGDVLPLPSAGERRPLYGQLQPQHRDLARLMEADLRRLQVVDWSTRDDVLRQMRLVVKQRLREVSARPDALPPSVHIDVLTAQIIALCRLYLS